MGWREGLLAQDQDLAAKLWVPLCSEAAQELWHLAHRATPERARPALMTSARWLQLRMLVPPCRKHGNLEVNSAKVTKLDNVGAKVI